MRLEFTIPGPPQPKQRARKGKGGRWYTPTPTRRYHAHVAACAHAALVKAKLIGKWPMDEEYMISIMIFFPDKRRRDADNVVKSIQDGCTHIIWHDDHRVGCYSPPWRIDRDNPRAEVVIDVLDPESPLPHVIP